MLYAPLDLPRVHPLDAPTTHPSVQASARAWLTAYDLAHLFGFAETTAIRPADADCAVEAWRCASDDEPRFELTASGRPRDPGRSMPDPAWLLVDHVDRYTEGVYTPPAVQLALAEGPPPSGYPWYALDLAVYDRSDGLCTTSAVAQVDEACVTDRPTVNFDVPCLCGDFLASHSQGYTLSDGTVKEPLVNHKGGICSGWCDQTCAAYRPVQLIRTNTAWQAVLAKATEVCMPEIFTGDLFRDWERLCGDEPPEFGFVWGVRTTGTETLMLGADGALGWLRAIEHNGSHRNHRRYIWHGPVDQPGETLESVEFAEARVFLASRPAPGQRGV